jgi:short-subunit dehydrogenase
MALRSAARGESAIVNISSIFTLIPEFTLGMYARRNRQ